MARIRGKGNKSTEIKLLNLFRTNGTTGWRRHQAITGKPDFVFRKARLAVCAGRGKLDRLPNPNKVKVTHEKRRTFTGQFKTKDAIFVKP